MERSERDVLDLVEKVRQRRGRVREDHVVMAHGAGGRASLALFEGLFQPAFGNLSGDQAAFQAGLAHLAITTDSYVVSPLFFPGGDIGRLAVNGTVNDLAVGGADPLCITAGFILEEGLPIETLRRVTESMAEAAREAGVRLLAGDTKVVPRGKADGLFVNTTGVGLLADPGRLGLHRIATGDAVVVSGPVGDHGTAVMLARGDLGIEADLESDSAPLIGLCRAMLGAGDVRFMRDATRGGLATVLNEIAHETGLGIDVREEAVPVREAVRGAAEILGIDPLYMANEGRLVAVVESGSAEPVLEAMRAHPLGAEAAVIGAIAADPSLVLMRTAFGGSRVVDMLTGDPLPRIC